MYININVIILNLVEHLKSINHAFYGFGSSFTQTNEFRIIVKNASATSVT